ncbi:hypothetical protein PBRA_009698 [Plasmodiophora brassicae]|uniref:Uncharacterized protein n=1 Tax=Plasmodiophora brassicae TaxID=37360 RepID=A0A0G4IL62_PLABS|nr:hypothetical protein PBRA_009698 [Plasmodiophora brassicae]
MLHGLSPVKRIYSFVVPNGNGRSVVDLALTRGLDSARLSVVDAPISTAHRMLVVASDHVVPERVDPKRYSWARRMFADPDDRPALSVLLAPAYNYLRALWLDATRDFDEIADHPTAALQDAVDSLYRHTTDVLRAVLEDIACWPSSRSKRGRTATMRPDWQALQRCDLRFYLSSMRRVFAATSQLQPSQRPSIEEFADHWKAVFEKPGVDDGPRLRSPRLSTDLDDEERHAFGPAVVTAIIKRHEWMKGVGPDNIPMDLLKSRAV